MDDDEMFRWYASLFSINKFVISSWESKRDLIKGTNSRFLDAVTSPSPILIGHLCIQRTEINSPFSSVEFL